MSTFLNLIFSLIQINFVLQIAYEPNVDFKNVSGRHHNKLIGTLISMKYDVVLSTIFLDIFDPELS